MTKKIIIICTALFMIVLSSQAQLRLGVKAGANISGVSTDGNINFTEDNVTGFQVGPTVEWLFIKNLGLEAAAVYSQKGIKVRNGDIIADSKTGYLEIPVNLKMLIRLSENFNPYVAAGPYINFKVSGDDTIGESSNNISNQWESQDFGAGLNFGAGVELFKFLQLGGNYGIGLTDDYKASNGDYSAKTRTWSITAAVYF
jgi:hypothetical protein